MRITLHEESVCGSIGAPKVAKVLREFSENEEGDSPLVLNINLLSILHSITIPSISSIC